MAVLARHRITDRLARRFLPPAPSLVELVHESARTGQAIEQENLIGRQTSCPFATALPIGDIAVAPDGEALRRQPIDCPSALEAGMWQHREIGKSHAARPVEF